MFGRVKKLIGAAESAPTPPAPAKEEKLSETNDKGGKEDDKEKLNKEEENKGQKEKKKEGKKEEEKKDEPKHAPGPAAPVPATAATSPEGADGEEAPPPPPPVVYSRYTDDTLRNLAKRLKERTQILREKVTDPYATSPEVSPPVTPLLRRDDYVRKKEEERIAKEEADKKKAEEAAKKAEEKKKKDEEKQLETEKKAKEERLAEEARKKAKVLPDIYSCFDLLFCPIENMMDGVLGQTIDPLDHRYITWLAVVVLAYNYNVWLCTARLVFPYHSPTVNMYWIICDLLSDVVNVIDICIWQPRLQFVKGGDIIKDRALTKVYYRKSQRFKMDIFSILPFDLLCLHFEFSSIYRFNRFMRVESFFEFSDRLENVMAKAYIWRVARTTGYLLFVLHLNACAYFVVSVHLGLATTTWVYDGKGTAYVPCCVNVLVAHICIVVRKHIIQKYPK